MSLNELSEHESSDDRQQHCVGAGWRVVLVRDEQRSRLRWCWWSVSRQCVPAVEPIIDDHLMGMLVGNLC